MSAPGHGRTTVTVDSRNATEGSLEIGAVVLQAADRSIAGTVVDEDGIPLENVRLHGFGANQPGSATISAEDGTFTLGPLCAGNFRIDAHHPDGRQGRIEVQAGAEHVLVVIREQSQTVVA